jgi:hypothetical protein
MRVEDCRIGQEVRVNDIKNVVLHGEVVVITGLRMGGALVVHPPTGAKNLIMYGRLELVERFEVGDKVKILKSDKVGWQGAIGTIERVRKGFSTVKIDGAHIGGWSYRGFPNTHLAKVDELYLTKQKTENMKGVQLFQNWLSNEK